MDTSEKGRLVVITGASQGIGAATALAYARKKACRLVLVSRNVEKLNAVAAQCAETGAVAHVFGCDVTDAEAVNNVSTEILDKLGAPDVVVNNAGAFAPSSIADMSAEVWTSQIDSNLTSAFLVTKAFLNPMIARRSGTFVFIGSVASIKGYPGGAAYCAAKHGMLGLARSLREECMEHGIRVITFLPGATFTPSWEASELPESRFIPPDELARLIVDTSSLSSRTVVEEIIVRPQLGDI